MFRDKKCSEQLKSEIAIRYLVSIVKSVNPGTVVITYSNNDYCTTNTRLFKNNKGKADIGLKQDLYW